MLTVDFERLGLREGDRLLDIGAGAGRHAFAAAQEGALVVAIDRGVDELAQVRKGFADMVERGESKPCSQGMVRCDALALPFAEASFDRVIAAEVLEHIPDDRGAMAEIGRVVRPGGTVAVTVPRWFPERICWALSDTYHSNEGGHIRIYKSGALRAKLGDVGLRPTGSHHAHALHTPYWWLKCAFGPENDSARLPRAYHELLVWDIMKKPRVTRVIEQALNPVLGKSLVVYLEKPLVGRRCG